MYSSWTVLFQALGILWLANKSLSSGASHSSTLPQARTVGSGQERASPWGMWCTWRDLDCGSFSAPAGLRFHVPSLRKPRGHTSAGTLTSLRAPFPTNCPQMNPGQDVSNWPTLPSCFLMVCRGPGSRADTPGVTSQTLQGLPPSQLVKTEDKMVCPLILLTSYMGKKKRTESPYGLSIVPIPL